MSATSRRSPRLTLLTAVLLGAAWGGGVAHAAPSYQRVPGPLYIDHPAAAKVSANGRYVVFEGDGPVTGSEQAHQVWIYDRVTRKNELVSQSSAGERGRQPSNAPAVSADGRYVAFYSIADNLVPNDTNRTDDVFVRDRVARKTVRVSLSASGRQLDTDETQTDYQPPLAPALSADGKTVVFLSHGAVFSDKLRKAPTRTAQVGNLPDPVRTVSYRQWGVYASRWQTQGAIELVNTDFTQHFWGWSDEAGLPAYTASPSISGNGRYVAFTLAGSNVTPVRHFTNDPVEASFRGAFVRDLVGHKSYVISSTGASTVDPNAPQQYADDSPQPQRAELDDSGLRAVVDLRFLQRGQHVYQQQVVTVDWKTHTTHVVQAQPTDTFVESGHISGDGKFVALVADVGDPEQWVPLSTRGRYDGPTTAWRVNLSTGAAVRLDACASSNLVCLSTELSGPTYSLSLSRDGSSAAFITPASLAPDDRDSDASHALTTLSSSGQSNKLDDIYVVSGL